MNKAKCKSCGDVVESKDTHDWQCCSCFHSSLGRGFYLDGGEEYYRCGGNFDDIEWVDGGYDQVDFDKYLDKWKQELDDELGHD